MEMIAISPDYDSAAGQINVIVIIVNMETLKSQPKLNAILLLRYMAITQISLFLAEQGHPSCLS